MKVESGRPRGPRRRSGTVSVLPPRSLHSAESLRVELSGLFLDQPASSALPPGDPVGLLGAFGGSPGCSVEPPGQNVQHSAGKARPPGEFVRTPAPASRPPVLASLLPTLATHPPAPASRLRPWRVIGQLRRAVRQPWRHIRRPWRAVRQPWRMDLQPWRWHFLQSREPPQGRRCYKVLRQA